MFFQEPGGTDSNQKGTGNVPLIRTSVPSPVIILTTFWPYEREKRIIHFSFVLIRILSGMCLFPDHFYTSVPSSVIHVSSPLYTCNSVCEAAGSYQDLRFSLMLITLQCHLVTFVVIWRHLVIYPHLFHQGASTWNEINH